MRKSPRNRGEPPNYSQTQTRKTSQAQGTTPSATSTATSMDPKASHSPESSISDTMALSIAASLADTMTSAAATSSIVGIPVADIEAALAAVSSPPTTTASGSPPQGTYGRNNGPEHEPYGDMHKIVLQGIMSAGFLNAKGVKRLFAGACTYLKYSIEERTTMKYIQKIVLDINERIKIFDMAIKSASCEVTGKKYYIFLITVERPIMKLQLMFTRFEIELFQKCMNRILRTYNDFSVPLVECLELAKEIRGPKNSIELAKSFLGQMVDHNYFIRFITATGAAHVTLGFRAIREFEPILREKYHDVIGKCSLCNMIMLQGFLCPQCKSLVHKPCYTRFIVDTPQCPNCHTPWGRDVRMIQRVRQDGPDGGDEVEMNVDPNAAAADDRNVADQNAAGTSAAAQDKAGPSGTSPNTTRRNSRRQNEAVRIQEEEIPPEANQMEIETQEEDAAMPILEPMTDLKLGRKRRNRK